MGISLGLVGLGSFGSSFAPLFKAHPLVDRIGLCDREPERIARFADDPFFADKFSPADAYASLDEVLESDLEGKNATIMNTRIFTELTVTCDKVVCL